jgi:GT2 family glycosyltransferase
MSEPNVMVGVPVADDMFADMRMSLWCYREVGTNGWKLRAERGGSAARNKNVIVKDFLDGDYTHLFFLNNDTWPDGGTIKDLIACDKDVVSGITPAFYGDFFWMGQIEKDVQIKIGETPAGLTPAARAGGPSMLIKRKVLDAMEFPWFDFEQIEIGAEESEDYFFCDKAISLGFEVWIEPGFVCHHNHNGIDILTMVKAMQCQN